MTPEGWFDADVEGFDEIDYVLDGEVELSSGTARLTAKEGDFFHIQVGIYFDR
jgi:ethanolamine utilization protein EutQ (cupin superfamily)